MTPLWPRLDSAQQVIRRHPWWTDAPLALFLTFISIGSVVFSTGVSQPHGINALRALLVILSALPVAVRRYRPLHVLAITVAAETALVLSTGTLAPPLGVIVALYTVAARCERPVAARAGAWVALPIAVAVIVDSKGSPGHIFPELALFAIAWVIGDSLRTRRAYLAELEDRAARLEREREERAERAVIGERARIARELHDVIAHNVSVMVVQASAGEEVFDTDPGKARESLAAIASTGRAALAELRRLLGVTGSEDDSGASFAPQPGIERLDELVGQVRSTGLAVELSVLGQPRALPEAVGLCAYRIVQEALTNTLKHAHAAGAQVQVRYRDDALELNVVDDGRGARAANGATGGHGIIGMRERVALFDGELAAGSRAGGGYFVRAMLPIPDAVR